MTHPTDMGEYERQRYLRQLRDAGERSAGSSRIERRGLAPVLFVGMSTLAITSLGWFLAVWFYGAHLENEARAELLHEAQLQVEREEKLKHQWAALAHEREAFRIKTVGREKELYEDLIEMIEIADRAGEGMPTWDVQFAMLYAAEIIDAGAADEELARRWALKLKEMARATLAEGATNEDQE